jgi:Transposase IS66 family
MLQTKESLRDVFGLTLPDCQAYRWKRYMSAFYKDLCSEILRSILNSPVIHIDETTVKLSSVPTLCEQNQLVIGNALNFVGHGLGK